MSETQARKITLALTAHEITVLIYLIDGAASPYARDPLKDIYEMGIEDEDFEPYAALKELNRKILAAVKEVP